MTETEAALLGQLVERAGQPVSREQLLREVWGHTRPVVTRCVDSAVRRLRVKLEAAPSEPRHLLKVYGLGYCLDLEGPPMAAPPSGEAEALFGRDAELLWLGRALERRPPRVSLLGAPGVGRATLAREAARRFAGLFPGGVAEERDPGGEGALALCFGAPPPARPGLTVLCVAPRPAEVPGERLLVLGPLSVSAALSLVRERGPGPQVGWAAAVDAVDRLPLALEELARRARLLTPDEMLPRLATAPERLLPLCAAKTRSRWALLSEDERAALRALSAFARREAPVSDCEALLGEGAMERLEALSVQGLLLREAAPGQPTTLRVPSLLRALATPGEAERAAHARWCVGRLEALHADFAGAQGEAAVDAAVALWEEAQRAHAWALGRDPVLAVRLALALDGALRRRGRVAAIAALQEAAEPHLIGVSEIWRSRWLQLRGERLRLQGALDEAGADAEEALRFAQVAGDPHEEAMALGLCAVVAHTQGAMAEAEDRYRRALAALPPGGLRARAGWMGNLARVLGATGRAEASERTLLELVDLGVAAGDARVEARARGELGRVLTERGLHGRAEEQLQASLKTWSALREPLALTSAWLRLGLLRADQGRWAEAEASLAKSQALADELGELRSGALARSYRGVVSLLQGDAEGAEVHLRRCVELHRASQRADLAVAALGWILAIEAGAGRLVEAGASAREAKAREATPGPQLRVQLCHLELSQRGHSQGDLRQRGLSQPGSSGGAGVEARRRARAVLGEVREAARGDVELRLACRHLSVRWRLGDIPPG